MFPILRCVYFNHRVLQPRYAPPQPALCWRLYWNRDASFNLLSPERSWTLSSDSYVLIPQQTAIGYEVPKPCWHLFLHFHLHWPLLKQEDLPPLWQTIETRHANYLQCLADEPGPQHQLSASASLAALALITEALMPHVQHADVANSSDNRIQQAITYMHTHMARPISNDEIAAHLKLSTNGFIRLFTNTLHISPQQHLTHMRLQNAAEALVYSDEGITAIADRLGFGNRNYFTTVFTRHYDLSPARFRKRGRDELDDKPTKG